ncbi:sensor histidine kinase [Maridesulfovibrio zosterae]|uniref:sensor histidine kinase n=1 Tax=Maridesulfovibrio zosterae TaxID=82171 RepID=UPI0004871B5A|nr:HAMP domain-containing sensor histidine kinase [Maridesulfovibrio zosterae]
MRISRLYLKIFLSFMLVLIVSELAVFAFLQMSWAQSPIVKHINIQIMAIKNLTEMELGAKYISAEYESKTLTTLLQTLGKSFHAQIWITGPYGEIVASSDKINPNISAYTSEEATKSSEGIYIYKKKKKGVKNIYAVYTANLPEGYPFTYHLVHSIHKFTDEMWFLRAQIIVTIIAAIFLIPVTRRMIRPIKLMTHTASKIEQGNLRQRVEIKGKDEISELARAFNNMAEGLEKRVKSSRELTANVSHELRSPLTRMRISLEMLKEKIENNQTSGCKTFVHGMQLEISHMDELIGKIIEFSKLDLEKSPAMNETADLKALIKDLLFQYEHSASRNKLKINEELSEIKISNCNRNGLRVIIDNILGNAYKYTENKGTVSIKLSYSKNIARIEVINTHAPLPKEDLEEIFNPFHRLKGHEIPGSGLGLAAAQKITLIHNGAIRAENSVDGFKIIVELPTNTGVV